MKLEVVHDNRWTVSIDLAVRFVSLFIVSCLLFISHIVTPKQINPRLYPHPHDVSAD